MENMSIAPRKVVSLEEAISLTGYGVFHILLLLVSGICLMCVIVETMCMMFIAPASQCDLDLNLSEKGLLSSVSFIGVVSMSFLWGYVADIKGRKNVLITSLATSSITTLLCSICPYDWLFILLRLLNGLCIGGASCTVYAYTGEFHDVNYRPKVISWMSTFVAMGNVFLSLFGWLILPQTWEMEVSEVSIVFRPWRLLLIIYTLPCMLCAIALYYFPESPKFLMCQGRKHEALEVLRRIYAINSGKNRGSYGVDDILFESVTDGSSDKEAGFLATLWLQTKPLFRGELLTKTLLLCFLQFGIFTSNAGLFMWYPEILNRMSQYVNFTSSEETTFCASFAYTEALDTRTSEYICNDTVDPQVFIVSMVIGFAYGAMYIFIGCFINSFGKKNLLVLVVIIGTTAGLVAQHIYGYMYIQILLGVFLMSGATIGITNAFGVDLFPTQVRSMALAVSLTCGRLGAMVATNVVGPILYNFCAYLFYFIAADHILLIIAVIVLPTQSPLARLQEDGR